MATNDFDREFDDRREFDEGYAVLNGKRVDRRQTERRASDKIKKKLKQIFDRHMEDTYVIVHRLLFNRYIGDKSRS
jgi:hypothetical protein